MDLEKEHGATYGLAIEEISKSRTDYKDSQANSGEIFNT